MLEAAPKDFWDRVVDRFVAALLEREKPPGFQERGPPLSALSAGAGVRPQGTGLVTNAERAAMALRVPGTMPTPAPTEAAE
jgi:hypothetical protein